jgi:hypothetical protein
MSPKPIKTDQKLLELVVGRALSGKGAHLASADAFSGLDVFQQVKHRVRQTRRAFSRGLRGRSGAANKAEWTGCVRRFQDGLKELERRSRNGDLLVKDGKQSRLEILHAIASHNSYHIGEAVVLRQILGKWPPPSGGLTW